jgi:Spirocyclase AveC-like
MATTQLGSTPRQESREGELRPVSGPRSTDASMGWFWVAVGGFWLALMIWTWGGWIISGDFAANKLGASTAPQSYKIFIHSVEVFAVLVTLAILWRFVIRDRIRTGRMTFDGLFFLACWTLFFQEPWINWDSYQFMYSTVGINFGSWTSHLPLWSTPHSEIVPVPIVWAGTAYLWLVAIPAYAGSRFMTRLRTRNPEIGYFRLLGTTFLAFVVFDLILESAITRTQLFSYASTVPSLTLFAGKKYQFPIYETLSWCATYLGLACIHHFRDDKGRTLVERGIDNIRVTGGAKTFARFLAIMGACQLVMLFTYNIPYVYWGLHSGPVPKPLVRDTWRNGGVCAHPAVYNCSVSRGANR